eukprot:CAMPEP_0175075320 /NCGR_PEP_ID=MMETSP0052_2-20121109/21924_1 /TAXON_ID=51329 ORGANISM="Polytomella parva, Strain SAG 63-3" /NCGR_SAMPLE_ID=MMETSP0052_2 /ASSEMBLY_ACC=CAM_ASM_000194 /LENGTH=382 /DNA_ID=CAMNT_0016343971 /DNA_START=168 /DNA_END=1313 /DNA_ORIENTATION=-
MAVDVVSEYEDVYDFVKEDEVDSSESDDEVESKIAEEHTKFLDAQAKWQEQIRASRPWSTPPLSSPRPEDQRQRDEEAKQLSQTLSIGEGSESFLPPPEQRLEFIPPERSYLKEISALVQAVERDSESSSVDGAAPSTANGLGSLNPVMAAAAAAALSSLSYLVPPRPVSASSASRRSRFSASGSQHSRLLHDIAEEPGSRSSLRQDLDSDLYHSSPSSTSGGGAGVTVSGSGNDDGFRIAKTLSEGREEDDEGGAETEEEDEEEREESDEQVGKEKADAPVEEEQEEARGVEEDEAEVNDDLENEAQESDEDGKEKEYDEKEEEEEADENANANENEDEDDNDVDVKEDEERYGDTWSSSSPPPGQSASFHHSALASTSYS